MTFVKRNFSIIACDVFEKELQVYLPELETQPLSVHFFKMGLHIRPDELNSNLQSLIDKTADEYSPEYILLLCGLCGNAVLGLKSLKTKLVIPRIHDCISMFLGSSECYYDLKKNFPRAYFASSGWINGDLLPSKKLYDSNRAMYEKKFADDPEMVEDLMEAFASQFKEYNMYFYTELISSPECREECRGYADFMGWDFRKIKSVDSFFKDAIGGKWDDRFLIVPEGESIKASIGSKILDA